MNRTLAVWICASFLTMNTVLLAMRTRFLGENRTIATDFNYQVKFTVLLHVGTSLY